MFLLLGLVSALVALGSGIVCVVGVWAVFIDSTADASAQHALLDHVVPAGLLFVVALWACTWAWGRSRRGKLHKTKSSQITHRVQRPPGPRPTVDAIPPTPRSG